MAKPIKFSTMKTTRHNGQPEGEIEITADDGAVLGTIRAEYDDPAWTHKGSRRREWRVVRYEVSIFALDGDDFERVFEVEPKTGARAALALAKAHARDAFPGGV